LITFLYIVGFAFVLVGLALMVGIAMCSHFGGDDMDIHP
jgi:hypothetical protein